MGYRFVEKQVLYAGRRVALEIHQLENEAGERIQKEVCVHPGAVVILPVVDDKTILLIRNRRHSIGRILIELPAGTLEAGEAPLGCAERELQEETGYLAERLEKLGEFYASPGILTEKMHVFAAWGLRRAQSSLDAGEEIEVCPTALEEAYSMIRRGEIEDGKTIATLLLYQLRQSSPLAGRER